MTFKHDNPPSNNLYTSDTKSIKFKSQFKIVFDEFLRSPSTMKEVSVRTGIDRANICRYCAIMRKAEIVQVHKKDYCDITHYIANRYTTDPQLFKSAIQLKLF